MTGLHFDGSVWCNVNIALRHLKIIYKQETEPLGLTITEWYVLRRLYEQDEQMASRLAQALGWAATSFTPTLARLQDKGFIERRSHPADQRAIRIYLTAKGQSVEKQVKTSAERIESKLRQQFSDEEWQGFQRVIESFQSMSL
jgi:DNA-binding MarR family transcriptional regulator